MGFPEPANLSLPDVLVASDLVGSSGFRARVGGEVSVTLTAHSYHWEHVPEGDSRPWVVQGASSTGLPAEMVLTGVVLPLTGTPELGGWVLDLAGVPIHVTAQDEGAAAPDPGTWVRLRGTVSVADDYIVDEVEPALRRPMAHRWRVQAITRLVPTGGQGERTLRAQPAEAIDRTADSSAYLVDLHRTVTEDDAGRSR